MLGLGKRLRSATFNTSLFELARAIAYEIRNSSGYMTYISERASSQLICVDLGGHVDIRMETSEELRVTYELSEAVKRRNSSADAELIVGAKRVFEQAFIVVMRRHCKVREIQLP